MLSYADEKTAPLDLLFTCLAVLMIFLPASFVEAKTIRFAPLPMENRETVVKQYRPMLLYLEKALDVTIDMVFSDNYVDIVDSFAKNQIDLAYLGPLPYVELRARFEKAEPLVHFNEASGKPMYTCAIVIFADSPLSLATFKNRRIALTQPLSTCGYLSANGLLQTQGRSLEENRYTYLDKHDAVALAVVRGEYDAGGVKTAIAQKYGHLGVRILAETAPMPSFGLVANGATLPVTTLDAIRTALTRLNPVGDDKKMLSTWGENLRFGAVSAADHDYDVVRLMKGNYPIPIANKEQ